MSKLFPTRRHRSYYKPVRAVDCKYCGMIHFTDGLNSICEYKKEKLSKITQKEQADAWYQRADKNISPHSRCRRHQKKHFLQLRNAPTGKPPCVVW